jgi:hypothetical protein
MIKLMLAVSALAAALALPVVPAQAVPLPQVERPQSEVIAVGRRHVRHRSHAPRVHRHRHYGFRRHYGFIGGPVYIHRYHYRGGCRWLRHRALVTGSSYWWHRYRACRYGW